MKIVKAIKKNLFAGLEAMRKEPVFDCLAELKQNQVKSSQAIEDFQRAKLCNLFSHVFQNVPYYKSRLPVNVNVQDIADPMGILQSLPILKKDELRNSIDEMISQKGRKVYPVKSSGSTGKPLKFYKDRLASAYAYAAMYRGLSWYGVEPCDKEALLWGIPIGKIDLYNARLRDFILNRFREREFNLSDDVNYEFYDKLIKEKPKFLSGYGTLIYEFSRFVHEKKLNVKALNIRLIKYTAEMMYEHQREFVSNIFSCPVVSEYGSAETGVVSFQCRHGFHHIMSDCVLVELVKHDNLDLYRVIVTNLNSFGFPIIRYDTGDLVRSGNIKKCSCGLPFPILDEIIGRSSDIVLTTSGQRVHSNIFSYMIKELVKKYDNITQLRFIQKKIDKINVEMLSNNDNDLLKNTIRNQIRSRLGQDMRVDFKDISMVKRTNSGKLRYFVSELKNE